MKNKIIILIHALAGWLLCGIVIGIGRNVAPMETTLIIHAFLVPIIFTIISSIYFTKFNHYSPIKTAFVFLVFTILMDFFVVALLIEKSMSMFSSMLGTWIPFLSIFIASYLSGIIIKSLTRQYS